MAWSHVKGGKTKKKKVPALLSSASPSLTQPNEGAEHNSLMPQPKEVRGPKINLPNKNLIHPSAKPYVPPQKRADLRTKGEGAPLAKKQVPVSEKKEMPAPTKELVALSEKGTSLPGKKKVLRQGKKEQGKKEQGKKELSLPEKPPPQIKSKTLWAEVARPDQLAKIPGKNEAQFPPLAKMEKPPQKKADVLNIVPVQPKKPVEEKPRPDNQHVPLSATKEVPLPGKEEVSLPDKPKTPLQEKTTSSPASFARFFSRFSRPKVLTDKVDVPPHCKTRVSPQEGRAVGKGVFVQPEKAVDDEPRPESRPGRRPFRHGRGQTERSGQRGMSGQSGRSAEKVSATDKSEPRPVLKLEEGVDNKPKPEEDVDNNPKPKERDNKLKPEEDVDNNPKPEKEVHTKLQLEEEVGDKIPVSLPAIMVSTPIRAQLRPQPVVAVSRAPLYSPVPDQSRFSALAPMLENIVSRPTIAVGTFPRQPPVPRRRVGEERFSRPAERAGQEVDSEAETLVSQPKDETDQHSNVPSRVLERFPIHGAAPARHWDKTKASWDLTAPTCHSQPDLLNGSNRRSFVGSDAPNLVRGGLPRPGIILLQEALQSSSLLGSSAEAQTSNLGPRVTPAWYQEIKAHVARANAHLGAITTMLESVDPGGRGGSWK